MKFKIACLSLAACVFASCEKSETKANPDETLLEKPSVANQASAPKNKEKPAQRAVASSAGNPVGTAPAATSPEPLTPEKMIAIFQSNGITGVPQDVADTILRKAARAETPDEQVRFITEQSAAWQHINGFKESPHGIPDHMKRMLIERLSTKHGDSWKDMASELDEQIAASVKVDELRSKGIPGMSLDESHELIIQAIEKYGPDYKAILSTAGQSARK